MKIKGTIVKGLGESGKFLAIDWVSRAVCDTFQFTPFSGTLNIDVAEPSIQRALKERGTEKLASRAEGLCDALTFRGVINGRYPAGVIIPLVPNYPEQILEIVAPVHLKNALGLNDGDEVELELED
ncbi:MAG: DNA-binding domain in riboflavin kinase [Deltaproteobacteria bacterium]|nr:DNA-binding domain in riboflavin kinase [Deltaproteobacteria bacterium]